MTLQVPPTLSGRSTLYASRADQRFSLSLYHPEQPPAAGLLVAVHGTDRDVAGTREAFIPFARRNNLAILAPLFPAGIDDRHDVDNYKFIRYHDIRFDEVLLAMIDEATDCLGFQGRPPIYLCGFSGGAQFAHRFLYLHPEVMTAVSIAAPGRITRIDDGTDWWHGTADAAEIFGSSIDTAALPRVPVHIVVGADDAAPAVDRRGQARLLAKNLRSHHVQTRLDVVDGVQHDLAGLVPAITEFFESTIHRTIR